MTSSPATNYILILLVSLSGFSKAQQDYDQGAVDARMGRDANYVQGMESPNYPDNQANLENPILREVRNPQYDQAPADFEGVDPAEEAPRPERQIEQTVEMINPEVAEMIPEAPVRKVRGNGADLSAEQTIIGSVDAQEIEIKASRSSDPESCKEEGVACVENGGCCSKFCSWTRGFQCHTFAG